ncbi:MAG: hypothetical protein M0Q92_15985 [Methanoregula sp.]|nr:hypothetical protein [Methanoregula sp.]
MAIVVFTYLILNIALIGSIGSAALATTPALVAAAAAIHFPHAGTISAFIGISAMFSATNAYIPATSRVLRSIAAWSSIPGIGDLNRRGTPAYALISGCVVSAGLL